MNDPNFIKIDISGGWFAHLLAQIDKNTAFLKLILSINDTSDESRKCCYYSIDRNERVKAKLLKYTDSSDCARLYRSEYQDIFHILLENTSIYDSEKEGNNG